MDDRAYHLQALAHEAVARAIAARKLLRRPCEECRSEHVQAHHDSYYPEKWLDVRWLCGKHHKAWHMKYEPEWPTIYEYHPTDHLAALDRMGTIYQDRAGRFPRPWFRKQKRKWYASVNGRQLCLGATMADAEKRLAELIAGQRLVRDDVENQAKSL